MANAEGNGWRPIPGWEGLYSASKEGSVRREPGSPRCPEGRLLKAQLHRSAATSYRRLALHRDGKRTRVFVHRLVLLTFVGPCPEGKVVCHKNGDSFDNRLENLEYDTQAANIRYNIWVQTQQKEKEWNDAQPEKAAGEEVSNGR